MVALRPRSAGTCVILVATLLVTSCGGTPSTVATATAPGTAAPSVATATARGTAAPSVATATAPGVTATSIALGVTSQVTGLGASVCGSMQESAAAVFDAANAKGGVHGRKIQVTLLDDAGSAPKAVANSQQMIQQPVFAGFLTCGTISSVAMYPIFEAQKVPLIFPYGGADELITPTKPQLFMVLPLYPQQEKALINLAFEKYGKGSVMIITSKLSGYENYISEAEKYTVAAGGKFVGSDAVNNGTADYTPYALRAKQLNPDYLLLTMNAADASRLINAMVTQDWLPSKHIIGTGIGDTAFTSGLNVKAAGKITTLTPVVVDPSSPAAAECVKLMSSRKPPVQNPGIFAFYGCAAAQLLVATFDKVGVNLTRESVLSTLNSLKDFAPSSALPPITFTPNNHLGINTMFVVDVVAGSDGKLILKQQDKTVQIN